MGVYEKPQGYIPRVVDAQIERYLRIFGAIEIAGAKWCGKTWAALQHGSSVSYVDENIDLAKADPSMMLLGERPHVIDEWQLVPSIRDVVRHEVDRSRAARGAFVLTGSSTPFGEGTERPMHSGAGRIGRVRMRTMSLLESGKSCGRVSLEGLFEGVFEPCKVDKDTFGLVEAACKGGWPEAVDLPVSDAQLIARDYLRRIFSESVPSLGFDGDVARRMAGSIARNLGQATTYKTIVADMYGAEDAPESFMDVEKAALYLSLLKSMYLVEEIPGWVPPARSRKRFATKPKRYLTDPSLAVAMLGLSPQSCLSDWQTFGLVFENLVMRDLLVYTEALDSIDEHPVRYYRDDSGLEVDAIVQLADGRWAAIEIKVSEDKVADGVASLKRLRAKLLKNSQAHVEEPTFMAVVTGNGEYARQVEPGIYVIPVRALGK